MSSQNNPVHPDVIEAAFAMRIRQLALPVGAQTFVGAAGAHALFEHGVERAFDLLEIGGDEPFRERIVGGGGER